MAMTAAEFIEKAGAEVVCGKIVVGIQADRIVVGDMEPTFVLNEEGQTILADLEAGLSAEAAAADATKKRTRKANGAAAANAELDAAPAPVEPPVEAQ